MGGSKKKKDQEKGSFKLEPELILRVINLIHVLSAPLTKVEESFNMQAIHDLVYHRLNLNQYDHLEFPGVVPRTFIGPLVVAVLSSPIIVLSQLFASKYAAQIIVRLCLCELVIQGLQKFRRTLSKEFGSSFGFWFILITGSQFHLIFYMGRTLPNVMALPGVFRTFHYWMKGSHRKFIFGAALSAIIFRSELALLFGFLLLVELIQRRIKFFSGLKYAVVAGVLSLALTILIDSYFWRRWLWPEGEVFYFNTILNKSSNYGTSPFLWYFYSALPRALLTTIFLVPFGMYINSRVRILGYVSFLFVLAFSFLPHKEVRFIFYVLPFFNVIGAAACDYLWIRRGKSFVHALLAVGLVFHLVVNSVLTTGLLTVSSKNYPGGNALLALHSMENATKPTNIHIDVYSAQTGITRFLQLNPAWNYDKTEDLNRSKLQKYDYLILEAREEIHFYKTHDTLLSVDAFRGIDFKFARFPPVRVKTEAAVSVLYRKK